MRSSRTSLAQPRQLLTLRRREAGLALRPIRAGLLDPVAERRLRHAQIARRGRDRLALIEDQSYRPRLVVIREAPPPPPVPFVSAMVDIVFPLMLEPHLHTLAALIAEQPDRTLAELKDALGTPASLATIWRAVAALDVTVKKNGPALRTRST